MVIVKRIGEKPGAVRTIRPDGKKGIWISTEVYSIISGIIFRQIKNSCEVTLVKIIDETRVALPCERNIELITLHVKLDLESKGCVETIQSKLAQNRGLLKVTSKGWKHFREEK